MRNFVICLATTSALVTLPKFSLASLNTFVFEVSNVVTPDNPSATVTLWANFDPAYYAFGESHTGVMTQFDRGWFSDPVSILDPWGYSEPGEVSPDGDLVDGIYAMQLYIPFSIYPEVGNPMSVWSVTWTTDDFTPREVNIATHSSTFMLYSSEGGLYDQFGVDFAEGSGVINVIPGPAGATALAGAGWIVCRRKR